MSDNTFLTHFGNGSHTKLGSGNVAGRLSAGDTEDKLKNSVKILFGEEEAVLQKSSTFNLDNVYGYVVACQLPRKQRSILCTYAYRLI